MLRRWSMAALAQIPQVTSETAESFLTNVGERLARQQTKLEQLSSCSDSRHLQYLHKDTHRLCQHFLLGSQKALNRWSSADQNLVCKTLEQIRDRHASSLERLVDLTMSHRSEELQVKDLLRMRYSVLLLCDHYVRLHKTGKGLVRSQQDVTGFLEPAIEQARHICDSHWMMSPDIVVDSAFSSPYVTTVPLWVHHALVELIKNGLHATLKRNSEIPTPLKIEVSHTDEFYCIDICDQGIGLPPNSNNEDLFAIGFSSASKRWDRLEAQQSYAAVTSPMSSLGVGLPLSRMMMQHFGGTVELEPAPDGARARIALPLRDDILECIKLDQVGDEESSSLEEASR